MNLVKQSINICIAIGLLSFIAPTAPVNAASDHADVKIEGFEYVPASVTIKAGGTVTFVNKDSAPHTVSPEKQAKFEDSGRMLKNESKTVTFSNAGVQHYFCAIHPSMKGIVTVVK